MSNLSIVRKKQQQAKTAPKAPEEGNDFPSLPSQAPQPQHKTQGGGKKGKKRNTKKGPAQSPEDSEPTMTGIRKEGEDRTAPAPKQQQKQQQQPKKGGKVISITKKGEEEAPKKEAASDATKKDAKEDDVDEEIVTPHIDEKIDDNDVQVALPPVVKSIVKCENVELLSNYYSVILSPGQVIYEYMPVFNADLGLRRKKKILESHKELGVFATDGNHLYTPQILPPEKLKWKFKTDSRSGADDDSSSEVRLKKTKEIKGNDNDIWRVLNIIKGRLLQTAGLQRIGRNYFKMEDKDKVIISGINNITFFPGITASFTPIQRGAAFVADILYKAVRKDTVLDIIMEAKKNKRIPEREAILKSVRGINIITLYSKRPYTIDDVDFTKNPKSTFDWKPASDKPVKKVSYAEYITERYGKNGHTTVTNMSQYMLVVNRKSGEKTYLIPELCRLTGLPDEMRRDFRVMKLVADVTHPNSNQHAEEINRYARTIGKDTASVNYMRPWGISLASEMLPVKGAILPKPQIAVGGGKTFPGISSFRGEQKPDFTFDLAKSHANVPASLKNWVCVIPRDRDDVPGEFIEGYLIDKLKKLGGRIEEPEWVECDWKELSNPRAIKDIIDREVVPKKPEFALFVLTGDSTETYNTIKRMICADLRERAFPTQVVKYNTIKNPKKVQGVSNKVAIQIVAKLGGVGYTVKILDPVLREGTMVVGIDVCHKGSGFKKGEKKSVVGLVASVDNTFVHCWAESRIQEHRKEIVNDLVLFVQNALAAYKKKNAGKYPKQVIVYRDGVGDGQLSIVHDNEVKQFEDAFNRVIPNKAMQPKLVFIVVKKNTNTRLFARARALQNPQPGTVVSSEIVHAGWYEFFLVPHIANQGMVSPTNFVVVKDDLKLDPVALQTFTYHQCFVYQNWSGSIKVPAMCQNAHKMAFLVGENIAEHPSLALAEKQFFL